MTARTLIVSLGTQRNSLVDLAGRELADYLERLTEQPVTLETGDSTEHLPSDAHRFIVGTAGTSPIIRSSGDDFTPEHLGSEGYRLDPLAIPGATLVAGGDAAGALYGVYALLEHYGCSFHLYGDLLPERRAALPDLSLAVERRPRYAVRGMQLWNYWHPGRDSWGFEDYRRYLDQYPKLGFNFFDFPLYFYEPLFTDYTVEGVAPDGYHLGGFDLDLIRIGREAFGSRERFTSPDIPFNLPQRERNRAAIDLMRRVFAYAHSRGIRTGIGIEPGNSYFLGKDLLDRMPPEDRYENGMLIAPSSASAEKLARARLSALLDAYPDLDVVTLWQPEIGPFRATQGSPHPADIAFRQRHRQYADLLDGGDYDYLEWVLLGYRLLKELRPEIQVASGGWGTERIFAASDDVWPPDLIRSTLAYYEPTNTLAQDRLRHYGETRAPKWHLPWAETDQHLWTFQPKTKPTYEVMQALDRYDVSGVMMVHWRNLFTDFDVQCFARGAWDKDIPLDALWRRWIRVKFGVEGAAADPVVQALDVLEAYNQHTVEGVVSIFETNWWIGLDCYIAPLLLAHRFMHTEAPVGQGWLDEYVHPVIRVAPGAIALLSQAEELLNQAAAQIEGPAERERFGYLQNRVTCTRWLFQAHADLAQAVTEAVVGLQAAANGDRETFHSQIEISLRRLNSPRAEELVRLFAERLGERLGDRDPGELGLLISLNQKFLGGIKRMEGSLLRLLDQAAPVWKPTPNAALSLRCGGALLPRPLNSTTDIFAPPPPWSREADILEAQPGFSCQPQLPLDARGLIPGIGCWTSRDRIAFTLTFPAQFKGQLRLYLYEDPEWDALLRWQTIRVNGEDIGSFRDFFCRGPYWDEGVWVEIPIAAANVTGSRDLLIEIIRSGNASILISGVELVSGQENADRP